MYHTKKRKRGGAMGEIVKECGKRKVLTCIQEFLQERGWKWVRVGADGNCFFYSIEKYYEMTNHGIKPNYDELRQQVADFIETKIYEGDSNTISVITGLSNNVENAMQEIRTNKIWNVDSFEMIPNYMARALGVHIDVYDARRYRVPEEVVWRVKDGIEEYRMTEFQPTKIEVNHLVPDAPSPIHIKLLRTGEGHYDLLWSDNEPYAAAAIKNNNEKVNNSMVAQQLQILQQIENNAKFAQQFQQFSINNKSLKKSSKPKVGVNPFISKVASLKLSPKASPNSYHSNVSSVVSNASMASPVGSFNRVTLENAEKELPYEKYMKYRKDRIHAFLDKHGTKYDKKATKEKLWPLFRDYFMKESNLRTKTILQNIKQTSKQARKIASRKKARNARRASKKAAKK